ncbi:hypothetical protein GQ457_05G025350 [Hibiscus cannabinus]
MEEASKLLLVEPKQCPESQHFKSLGILKFVEAESATKYATTGISAAQQLQDSGEHVDNIHDTDLCLHGKDEPVYPEDICFHGMQNQEDALKYLENQIGQISQVLNTRPVGGFPRDIEVAKGSTHEQCKGITTRSGKSLSTPNKSKQGGETIANPNATTVTDNPASIDTPTKKGEDQ